MLSLVSVRPVLARLLEKLFEVRALPGRAALQDWLEVALWTTIFLLGAITAPATSAGTANAPGQQWIEEKTGGGICLYKRATGIECPACGLSRGFVQLEHGELVAAVKLNPLAPVVFFLMASRLVFAVCLCALRVELRHRIPNFILWKLWGMLFIGAGSIGVYRVILRFM